MDRLTAPPLPDWITAQLPPDVERYRLDVGGQAMHVMERGARDALPVVMVHGNPTWGFLWRKVAGALAADPVRCVMPDLIGLGLSDKPRDAGAHSIAAHAAWLGAALDRLALPRFILVVQDWGGAIGFCAAAERAERVAGLVVLNTAIGPPRPGFKPTAFHRFAAMPGIADVVFRGLHFPQAFMNMAQGDKRSIGLRATAAYVWPLRHLADRVAPLAMARMVPDSLEHPSIAALALSQSFVSAFRGAAAIVWGDRDPVLGRLRTWVEKNLPQAAVTRTAAGHFLQEEVAGDIAAAIRNVARAVAG
ncbi:MAG: alpha/beta fold hydrolase [Myxococcota bacterium]